MEKEIEYVEYVEERATPQPQFRFVRFGKYSFSFVELRHLLLALFMLLATFAILQQTLLQVLGYASFSFIIFVTVGLGFLLHELGHKFVAQHFGFVSEFRGDFPMMLVSLAFAFSGFTLLAPGAVMILGRIDKRQNGIISIAGPLVNLCLALFFVGLNLFFSPIPTSFFGMLLEMGIVINVFLGLFNMIPFWIFDGKKVLEWSKPAYFSTIFALLFVLVFWVSSGI
ncbi:metalloprotease [Candidatus Woesearchaeota archaeon]|nr:metalloprotease [Nanoarchaeota archaeon]MCB9370177.1 metalloprotease [Candidatus Woesearchaeota archaeon]USN44707.1 MAG: metalloprotease [Candidatus Woesearchaeota archaeon]